MLRRLAKMCLPTPVRSALRSAHRDYVFQRAMRRFLDDPAAATKPGNTVVRDLVYGWGNDAWSALDDYLVACIDLALSGAGPILECGSGLSTLLVGAVASQRGEEYWALEHHAEWTARVAKEIDRYSLHSVSLYFNSLKDYGDFAWYDPPLEWMPQDFGMVICDGPPGDTKGGRYGMLPVMRDSLKSGCVILLDDADRPDEIAIARRWERELGTKAEFIGATKRYAKLIVR